MMSWKITARFLSYLKNYWKTELLLLLLMLTGSLGSLATPYILQVIIDKALPGHDYQLLVKVLLILVGIYIIRIAATCLADYIYTWVSARVVIDIRKDLFRQLIHMPVGYYHKNKTGDIVYKINNEVTNIQNILTNSLLRILNNVITITGLIFALCWLNYRLFLLSSVVFPFIFLSMKYFTPRIRKTVEQWRLNESDLLGYFTECFRNVRLIRSFNTHDYEENRLLLKSGMLMQTNLQNTLYVSLNRNVLSFFIALGPVIVLWWGGRDVLLSAMTTGALVAFMQYLMRLYSPSTDMFSLHADVVRASVSMKKIFEILEQPSQAALAAVRNDEVRAPVTSVVFEQVYFSYDDTPVLQDISFRLERGKKYALVGESGCGKSTIADLLCQFCQPSGGRITINGRSLSAINPYSWMQQVAVVNQECFLFQDSIPSNIRYGNFEREEAAVDAAATAVGFNVKHNTSTGLSGGQKQQIGIARVLLKAADIVILDEATSALDSITEKAIFDNISEFYQDKIIIMISHRVSTIAAVDEIICIRNGQIAEQGSHEQLRQKKGYYWTLFKGQHQVAVLPG